MKVLKKTKSYSLWLTKSKKMKLASKPRPKTKRLKLKTFGGNWPKLKKNVRSQKLTEKSANIGKNHLEKNVEELRSSKERCFEKSLDCVKKIKTSFANVGAYSTKENFIRGDPEGIIEWISGEVESFEEILSDRGDVCAFSGAWGISAILEKAGCDHMKTMAQAEADFSTDDTMDPSAEATLMGGKFYNDVWVNGGREMAHEIIQKSEKDTHDARIEAIQAEEAAERENV
jgi:hypothetical protein